MSNQKSQVTGVVVVMLFALIAMTAAFARSSPISQTAEAESMPASPSATPPAKETAASPVKKEATKIVGTCNTARGCAALKDACKSLQKHSFKATSADGSLGVCTTLATFYLRNTNTVDPASRQPPTKPTADVGLTAPVPTSEATVSCFGTLFCTKVKKICAALGGDYQTTDPNTGTCHY